MADDEPDKLGRFSAGYQRGSGGTDDPFGSFLAGFQRSRAAAKARAAEQAQPAIARVASGEYQPSAHELQAQEDYLTRARLAKEGRPGALEAPPTPSTADMTGGAPRGDYSMAAMRRVPILTAPSVVPNRATPEEMDAMSNADFLAARGKRPETDADRARAAAPSLEGEGAPDADFEAWASRYAPRGR